MGSASRVGCVFSSSSASRPPRFAAAGLDVPLLLILLPLPLPPPLLLFGMSAPKSWRGFLRRCCVTNKDESIQYLGPFPFEALSTMAAAWGSHCNPSWLVASFGLESYG